MGCDYYMYIYLDIEHKYGTSYYQLKTKRGHYPALHDVGYYDSDDDEQDRYYKWESYDFLYSKLFEFCLTPRKPVVIFENGEFKNDRMRTKYLPILQDKIDKKYVEDYYLFEDKTSSNYTDINDIIKVTKKEIRAEVGEGPPLFFNKKDNKIL